MKQIISRKSKKSILMIENGVIKYQVNYIYSNKWKISNSEELYVPEEDDKEIKEKHFEEYWNSPGIIFSKYVKKFSIQLKEDLYLSFCKEDDNTILIEDRYMYRLMEDDNDIMKILKAFSYIQILYIKFKNSYENKI